jgi:hypothetical protein
MYFNIAAILHFSKNVTIIVPSNNKIKTYNLTSCHRPKRVIKKYVMRICVGKAMRLFSLIIKNRTCIKLIAITT